MRLPTIGPGLIEQSSTFLTWLRRRTHNPQTRLGVLDHVHAVVRPMHIGRAIVERIR